MNSPAGKLRARQMTITAAVFLLFLILPASVGIAYHNDGLLLKQQVLSQLQNEENIAASAIEVRLNHLVDIASSLATSPQLVTDTANGQWSNASSFAQDAENNVSFYDPYIDRTVFFDKDGTEQAAYPTLSGGIGASVSTTDWYSKVLAGETVVTSVVKRQATPSINVVNIAVPIMHGGATVGILTLQIPTDNFLDFNSALSTGIYGFTYIVDPQGNVIAHPKYSSTDIVNLASTHPIKEILAGQSGTMVTTDPGTGQTNFLIYSQVPKYNWGIVIQEPYDEAFAAYDSTTRTITIAESMLLAIDLLITYLIFRFFDPKRFTHTE